MLENHQKFLEYREKYPVFIYEGYKIEEMEDKIHIEYEFSIPDLTAFHPTIDIPKKSIIINPIDNAYVENMVFHIGLIELISYWKCTCSPKVIIKCGSIDKEQIQWLKKLYFYGLGELFYTNQIHTNLNDFMEISCQGKEIDIDSSKIEWKKVAEEGYIIPIGGGKDSFVTLELLKKQKGNLCFIVNPKPITKSCAKAAGYEEQKVIEIYRKLDPTIIELKDKGYINGHTPFSSLLAFISYFTAYLTGKTKIALSNESSANESNVAGEKINHQYSKSIEFENDFRGYAKKYLKLPIEYFSFLRPLNELQIAKLFSRYDDYHKIFKSCNVGSKGKEWKWCCNCPKCLFVYTILSPFLYEEKLVNIFGEDLFEKQDMLDTFLELAGQKDVKPFECVGTFEEVRYAISKTIENLKEKQAKLPYLLEYYEKHYTLQDTKEDITKRYNEDNNLPKELDELLKKEVNND